MGRRWNKIMGIGWRWVQNILPCHPLIWGGHTFRGRRRLGENHSHKNWLDLYQSLPGKSHEVDMSTQVHPLATSLVSTFHAGLLMTLKMTHRFPQPCPIVAKTRACLHVNCSDKTDKWQSQRLHEQNSGFLIICYCIFVLRSGVDTTICAEKNWQDGWDP